MADSGEPSAKMEYKDFREKSEVTKKRKIAQNVVMIPAFMPPSKKSPTELIPNEQTTNFLTFFPTFLYFIWANTFAVVLSIIVDWTVIIRQPVTTFFKLLFVPFASVLLGGVAVVTVIGQYLGAGKIITYISNNYYHSQSIANWGTPNPLACDDFLEAGLEQMSLKEDEKPSFDVKIAKTLLYFSSLVYEDSVSTRQKLQKLNLLRYKLESVHTVNIPGRSTLGDFATIFEFSSSKSKEKTIIVSFKGTSPLDLNQWLVDIAISKTDAADYLYGNVHDGFYSSMFRTGPNEVEGLYVKIAEYIRKRTAPSSKDKKTSYRLWVTGHSLGAALATLFFSRVINSPEDIPGASVEGAYTYGNPRVGNVAFHAGFTSRSNIPYNNKVRLYRVANVNDPVTMVPFGNDNPDVLSLVSQSPNGPLNFIHVGTPEPIHRHPFYSIPANYPNFVVSSSYDLFVYFYQSAMVALGVTHFLDWIAQWSVFFDQYNLRENCLYFDIFARLTFVVDHLPCYYLHNLQDYEKELNVKINAAVAQPIDIPNGKKKAN